MGTPTRTANQRTGNISLFTNVSTVPESQVVWVSAIAELAWLDMLMPYPRSAYAILARNRSSSWLIAPCHTLSVQTIWPGHPSATRMPPVAWFAHAEVRHRRLGIKAEALRRHATIPRQVYHRKHEYSGRRSSSHDGDRTHFRPAR